VTPVHFAAGLFGSLCAGLAVSRLGSHRPASLKMKNPMKTLSNDPMKAVSYISIPIVLILTSVFGYYNVSLYQVEARKLGLEQRAAFIHEVSAKVPSHPVLERYRIEYGLLLAETIEESNRIVDSLDDEPDYLIGFGPNLVRFAQLTLDNAESMGSPDTSRATRLLESASGLMPMTPALIAEQFHVALIEGDRSRMNELRSQVESIVDLYPPAQTYLSDANMLEKEGETSSR
jgi:hypothetical protein